MEQGFLQSGVREQDREDGTDKDVEPSEEV